MKSLYQKFSKVIIVSSYLIMIMIITLAMFYDGRVLVIFDKFNEMYLEAALLLFALPSLFIKDKRRKIKNVGNRNR